MEIVKLYDQHEWIDLFGPFLKDLLAIPDLKVKKELFSQLYDILELFYEVDYDLQSNNSLNEKEQHDQK